MDLWITTLLKKLIVESIRFDQVSLSYIKDQPLLTNVSFTIPENSFVLIIGPTGSGKSTLMRLIKGIIPYLLSESIEGNIIINGQIKDNNNFFEQGLNIGYLLQDFDLQFIGSNVENELVFGLENMGIPKDDMNMRLDWFFQQFPSLIDLKFREPQTLSGGELAKVEFISSVITDPSIILLDEPLENLDKSSRDEFFTTLKHFKNKKTIVVCTHEIEPYLELADKIIVLNNSSHSVTEYDSIKEFFLNISKYSWLNISKIAIDYYNRRIQS